MEGAVGEALEQWQVCFEINKHEEVVRSGGEVRRRPWLDDKAVGLSGGGVGEGGSDGHCRVMESEGGVGVVDSKDAVGAGGIVEH